MIAAQALAVVRVLVVGDVMLDRYWFGEVSRISPEAPVPAIRSLPPWLPPWRRERAIGMRWNWLTGQSASWWAN